MLSNLLVLLGLVLIGLAVARALGVDAVLLYAGLVLVAMGYSAHTAETGAPAEAAE